MNRAKKCIRIGCLLFVFNSLWLFSPLYAQLPGLNFSYLTMQNGLSDDAISCIFQDRDGFMWFGSEGGVDKYDGRRFLRYYNFIKDSTSKTKQTTPVIYEDSFNGIWFVNDTNGLVLLNKRTEEYSRFRYDPEDPHSLSNNKVRGVLEDSHRNLWFVTLGKGLNMFNRNDSTFKHFLYEPNNKKSIGSNFLSSIAEDNIGNIWIVSLEGLLIRFDPENLTFENIKIADGMAINNSFMNSPTIYVDMTGNVWFACNLGLYRYHPSDKSLKKFSLKTSENIFPFISSLLEIEKDRLLITTYYNGLYILDSKTGYYSNYSNNPVNPFGLNSNKLSRSFKSRDGIIWIGSSANGINIYNKHALRFPKLMNIVDTPYQEFSSYSTISLCEDPDGKIWMGTESNGIQVYDPLTGKIQNPLPELRHMTVFCMFMDSENNIWIGTIRNGLFHYDWNTKSLKQVSRFPGSQELIAGKNITRIFEDTRNRLWIAYLGDGVSMFDRKTNTLFRFRHDPISVNSLSNNIVFRIFEDKDRNIWVGTASGLNLFDQEHNSFIRIPLEIEKGKGLSHPFIYDIFEDSKGRLWIASDHTLNFLKAGSDSSVNFSYKAEDNIFTVAGILEDKNHLLWLSTFSGILSFDPKTGIFHDFGLSDGIRNLKHNGTACLLSKKGFMYFGSDKGVTVFNPENISSALEMPEIFITDLSINNVPVDLNGEDPVLTQSIRYTDNLKLNHKQSTLSFRFIAIDYSNPESNQYAYRLEGFDDDWVNSGNSNRAYYANLPPGRYVFKVIGSNGHGLWNTTGKQISILIRPPIWYTWWFIVWGILAISALIILLHFSRVKALQKQKTELEGIVNQRTKTLNEANTELKEQHEELLQQHEEISAQNEMLSNLSEKILVQNAELEQHRSHLELLVDERTKELEVARIKAEESDKLKSAFLANMSHEIRTPMNAIVGFANLLKDMDHCTEEMKEFVEIINSNSEVLLVLIDDILDLSLIEADQLTIKKEILDLNEILEGIYSSFSKINKKEELVIRLNNELYDQKIKVNTDSVRIRQIMTNLMNNAYKFTHKGSIELGVKRIDKQLIFYVRDTGIGIDEKDLEKIFERFRKSELKINTLYRGTGLGLAISLALARLLGGNLRVESTLGAGSVFYLMLPDSLVSFDKVVTGPESIPVNHKKWTNKNILIVEDEHTNYLYVRRILEKTEVNIHWAENGLDAVNLFSSGIDFHLILMDIKMPVMDGFEATRYIRESNPEQVIIALTAYARPEDKLHFMKAGFTDYLSKPIKPDDFMNVIRKYI